jgi:Sigma-70 region 2/Pentapeptide repeats (8 copies)
MEEHEVVAAIVAGDPSGLTEALDKYAASLFAYCRSILPQAEAADVVGDTFVIARNKLDVLHDPGKLGIWLQAVARNECQRRLITKGETPGDAADLVSDARVTAAQLSETQLVGAQLSGAQLSGAEPVGADLSGAELVGAQLSGVQLAEAQLPEGLTGRIMKFCTDDTPTGRAYRTTVTHLAGSFGHDGFPRPIGPSRRRRQLSRMSFLIAGIAVAVVCVIAGIIVAASGGPHPGHTAADAAIGRPGSTVAPSPAVSGTGASGTRPSGAGASGAGASGAGASSAAGGTKGAGPKASPNASNAASRKASSPQKKKAPNPSPTSQQPAPPVMAVPPLPSPSPSPTRRAAVLIVNPGRLSLVSLNDVPAQATFTITAFGGPIRDYTIVAVSSRGHIIATPVTGSLGRGQQARILVTGWGKASFTAQIHIYPGNHVVTVHVKATKSKG